MSSSIDHTVKKVSDEALDEMLSDLRSGKTSASEAVSQRVSDTKAEAQRILEQEERQADALRRQIIGAAEMTARNKSLEIIEENLNATFDQSMKRLEDSTRGPQYEGIIRLMILEAVDQVGGDDFDVQANQRDQKILPGVFEKIAGERRIRLKMDSEPITKSVGGVIVKSADGFVTFDNTFEARLERLRPVLRKQVAQLFTENLR